MILVSGATGTVGSELVRCLEAQGLEYRALVRNLAAGRARLGDDAPLVEGTYEDRDSLQAAMDDVGTLFLLCPPHPEQHELERALVDAADESGVERIVKVSALGAREGSPIGLADQHARTERYIREIGLEHTFLQPSAFMQNLLAHAPTIRASGTFYAAHGEGRVSMIDARDVATVAAAILADGTGHDEKTYVLTGPEAASLFDAARVLTEVVGRPVTYRPISPEEARDAMLAQGLPTWLVDDLVRLSAVFATGAADALTSVVEDVTGRPPRSLKVFAADHAQAFMPGWGISGSAV